MSSQVDIHALNTSLNNSDLRIERLKTDLSLMQALGEVDREQEILTEIKP